MAMVKSMRDSPLPYPTAKSGGSPESSSNGGYNNQQFFNTTPKHHQSKGGQQTYNFGQQESHQKQQQQQGQHHQPQTQPKKEEWFSLEGYLQMKCQSGALTFLQSKKRLYFGLEEFENKLIYYRDKTEFNRKRECLGTIPLHNVVCSLIEGNLCAFVLHTTGKKYVLEANNARCANCWLNALQQRRDLSDATSAADLPTIVAATLHRRRSRSRSRSLADARQLSLEDSTAEEKYRKMSQIEERKDVALLHVTTNAGGNCNVSPLTAPSKLPQLLYRQRVEKCAEGVETAPITYPILSNGHAKNIDAHNAHQLTHDENAHNNEIQSAAWLGNWIGGWLNEQNASAPITGRPTRQNAKFASAEIVPEMRRQSDGKKNAAKGVGKRLLGGPDGNEIITLDLNSEPDDCFTYVGNGASQPSAETHINAINGPVGHLQSRSMSVKDLKELAQNFLMSSLPPARLTAQCNSEYPSTTTRYSGASSAYSSPAESASPIDTVSPSPFFDELSMLRIVDNRQKERIHELNAECTNLTREIEQLRAAQRHQQQRVGQTQPATTPAAAFGENADEAARILSIATQNRFLNAELLRVNNRCIEAKNKVNEFIMKIDALESEIEEFKRQYVFLLQSCIRVPLHEHSSCDVVQVKLFGGDIHKYRVCLLLDKARESDPTLPTFESLTTPGNFHVDDYGFRHFFEEVPLALHYAATQLNQHYESQSESYLMLKCKWQEILNASPHFVQRTRENRHLCRLGVPRAYRSRVWRLLIHQQVVALKARYGEYYYRNLCSSHGTPAEKHYCSTHQKQINLDLLRTMPGNIHFMSASCKGVTHLQAVLRAFCLHNPSTGYCQGMNFLAATALLFVSPEDAFWFLVAVTESYFHPSYFDQSLSGAQADQEVLKEIVEQKFPLLANHLEECDIDLTTITLNWFLALFFDAVPFQTMLRIWDCFLFEGPKVLFRFTIALLGLYQDEILDHTDTISVMKVLKAAVRLTYDIDGLIKYSFEELNPFPSKTHLRQRHALYLEVLQEKLHKRLQLRKLLNVISNPSTSDKICDLPIEVIVFNEFVSGCGYVCAGNEKRGKLSLISLHNQVANLNTLDIEFDCRPLSMVIFHEEMAFVSLLSGYIVAIQLYDDHHAEILWELKLNDMALRLLRCDNRLYSLLANGMLTILENAFEKMPSTLDLYHIPVSAAPISDALFDDENFYLAVACKIVILNRFTLHTTASVYVASSATGSQVPMFEKIRAMANSEHGIWLITAHSSLLQLWKGNECQMLFDITYDHSHRRPSPDDEDQLDQVEIYSIMYHDKEVWIGTVDGYLMLYRVLDGSTILSLNAVALQNASPTMRPRAASASEEAAVTRASALMRFNESNQSDQSMPNSPDSLQSQKSYNRYPPGRRLSPIQNAELDIPRHRQQMYYIPTDAETRVEENACVNEYPESERQTRKISVIIDQSSRNYSVNVKSLTRQMSEDVSSLCAESNFAQFRPNSSIISAAANQRHQIDSLRKTQSVKRLVIESILTQTDSLSSSSKGTQSNDFEENMPKVSAVSSDAGFVSGSSSPSIIASPQTGAMGVVVSRGAEPGVETAQQRKQKWLFTQQSLPEIAGLALGEESHHLGNGNDNRNASMIYSSGASVSTGAFCLPSFPSTIAEEEFAANATPERELSPARSFMNTVDDVEKMDDMVDKNSMTNKGIRTPRDSNSRATANTSGTAGTESKIDAVGTVAGFEGAVNGDPTASNTNHEAQTPVVSVSSKNTSPTQNPSIHSNPIEILRKHSSKQSLEHVVESAPPTSGHVEAANNLKLRRKDLDFDENLFAAVFNSVSGKSTKSTTEDPEIKSSLGMALQMKLKISDKPVKCIALTRFNDEDVVVTGAGNYGDEEAILRWRREKNSNGVARIGIASLQRICAEVVLTTYKHHPKLQATFNAANTVSKCGQFSSYFGRQFRLIHHSKSNGMTTILASSSTSSISSIVGNVRPDAEAPEIGRLVFNADFESGNLGRVDVLSLNEYDLFIRPDTCNPKYRVWFYFSAENAKANQRVLLNIVNFSKIRTLFDTGSAAPVFRTDASKNWSRIPAKHIYYYRSQPHGNRFILSFVHVFQSKTERCEFAYCIPYTYTDLENFLGQIERRKLAYFRREPFCLTVQKRHVDLLTISSPEYLASPTPHKYIFLMARVHPGETPSSIVLHGFLEFLLSDEEIAVKLRSMYVFKVVPMLNPDGVYLGNYRCSLMGFDLNRQWQSPSQWAHPSIAATKNLLMQYDRNPVVELCMCIDLHSHSQQTNSFLYGNLVSESPRTRDLQLYIPYLLADATDDYSLQYTQFNTDAEKAGTNRRAMGEILSEKCLCYTLEVSFFSYRCKDNPAAKPIPYLEDSYRLLGANLARAIFEFSAVLAGARRVEIHRPFETFLSKRCDAKKSSNAQKPAKISNAKQRSSNQTS